MTIITASLQSAGRDGIEMTGGDGAVRRCHPILACYVADYPEQALVCCTRFGTRCPKCHAVKKQFEDHDLPWEDREQHKTLATLRHAAHMTTAARRETVLKSVGLTHVEAPFWANLPYTNIHAAITPDILHQLLQGMIKYLVAWVSVVVTPRELDARFKRLPETDGARLFSNGISGLVQVSGQEHKEISKQLLACLVGKAPPAVVRAARGMLDFLYIAQYKSHSDQTLEYLDAALTDFHKNKQIFLKESARLGKCFFVSMAALFSLRVGGNFNLPKLHGLEHYTPSIRSFGTTDNTNTEATERLHIDFAKDAYRATNKKEDHLEQMTWWLDRRERLARFDVRVRWRLNELPSPHSRTHASSKSPIIPILVKTPSQEAVTFADLASKYHAKDFLVALRAFIAEARCTSDAERKKARRRTHPDINIPFNAVDVWHRLRFSIPNVQVDDEPNAVRAAVVSPAAYDGVGRFDTVLVEDGVDLDDDDEPSGVKRMSSVIMFASTSY